jgi:uncharacterized protein YjbI with pentapeptide repeats
MSSILILNFPDSYNDNDVIKWTRSYTASGTKNKFSIETHIDKNKIIHKYTMKGSLSVSVVEHNIQNAETYILSNMIICINNKDDKGINIASRIGNSIAKVADKKINSFNGKINYQANLWDISFENSSSEEDVDKFKDIVVNNDFCKKFQDLIKEISMRLEDGDDESILKINKIKKQIGINDTESTLSDDIISISRKIGNGTESLLEDLEKQIHEINLLNKDILGVDDEKESVGDAFDITQKKIKIISSTLKETAKNFQLGNIDDITKLNEKIKSTTDNLNDAIYKNIDKIDDTKKEELEKNQVTKTIFDVRSDIDETNKLIDEKAENKSLEDCAKNNKELVKGVLETLSDKVTELDKTKGELDTTKSNLDIKTTELNTSNTIISDAKTKVGGNGDNLLDNIDELISKIYLEYHNEDGDRKENLNEILEKVLELLGKRQDLEPNRKEDCGIMELISTIRRYIGYFGKKNHSPITNQIESVLDKIEDINNKLSLDTSSKREIDLKLDKTIEGINTKIQEINLKDKNIADLKSTNKDLENQIQEIKQNNQDLLQKNRRVGPLLYRIGTKIQTTPDGCIVADDKTANPITITAENQSQYPHPLSRNYFDEKVTGNKLGYEKLKGHVFADTTDFSNVDFSHTDLSGEVEYWGRFVRTDFTGANLTGAKLQGVNLEGAIFNDALLSNTNLGLLGLAFIEGAEYNNNTSGLREDFKISMINKDLIIKDLKEKNSSLDLSNKSLNAENEGLKKDLNYKQSKIDQLSKTIEDLNSKIKALENLERDNLFKSGIIEIANKTLNEIQEDTANEDLPYLYIIPRMEQLRDLIDLYRSFKRDSTELENELKSLEHEEQTTRKGPVLYRIGTWVKKDRDIYLICERGDAGAEQVPNGWGQLKYHHRNGLKYEDLKNRKLKVRDDAEFQYTDLRYADFSGSEIEGINSGEGISHAFFDNADLTGAKFIKSTLYYPSFINCTGDKCDFTGSKFYYEAVDYDSRGHLFQDASFKDSKFINFYLDDKGNVGKRNLTLIKNVDFSGATFDNFTNPRGKGFDKFFKFENVKFINAKMINFGFSNKYHESSVDGATLEGVDFTEADVKEIYFGGCTLNSCTFDKANLTNANYTRSSLTKCTLDKANLTGADLRNTNLQSLRINYAAMKDVKFDNAKLKLIEFDLTDLSNASFKEVEFIGKNYENHIRKSKLFGANFENIKLSGGETPINPAPSFDCSVYDQTTTFTKDKDGSIIPKGIGISIKRAIHCMKLTEKDEFGDSACSMWPDYSRSECKLPHE